MFRSSTSNRIVLNWWWDTVKFYSNVMYWAINIMIVCLQSIFLECLSFLLASRISMIPLIFINNSILLHSLSPLAFEHKLSIKATSLTCGLNSTLEFAFCYLLLDWFWGRSCPCSRWCAYQGTLRERYFRVFWALSSSEWQLKN